MPVTILVAGGGVLLALLVAFAVVPLIVPVRPLPGLREARSLAAPDSRFVSIDFPGTAGLELHYRDAGARDATPGFLLLHGFTFNISSWAPLLGPLARHGRVVAYDRIPFGLSAKPGRGEWSGENPYGPDATLKQLQAFTAAVGLARPIIVGNSAGGLLAARAVLAEPEGFDGLILVCPALLSGPGRAAAPLLHTPQLRRIGPLIARRVGHNEWLLRRSYGDPAAITAEQIRLAEISTGVRNWDQALWEFIAAGTNQPSVSVEELQRIRLPTLIIGAANDKVIPTADYRKIAAAIPGADFVMIANAGHVPQEERPAEVVEAIAGWLKRRGLS